MGQKNEDTPKGEDRSKAKAPRRAKPAKPRGPRTLGGFFLRGIVTLLPVVLTLVVFGLLYQMIDRYVTGPINGAIYWSLERNTLGWNGLDRLGIDPLALDYLDEDLLPAEVREFAKDRPWTDKYVQEQLAIHREPHLDFFRDLEKLGINGKKLRADVVGVVHPIFGVLISLLLVLWLGWLVGGFVGRKLVKSMDQAMHVIPVVKSVYPYSKQLVEFFFAEKKLEFDTVVAVPYPSPGIWSIAFVTGDSMRTVRDSTGLDLITCFVPSSPMPMTGYTIFVEGRKAIPLPMSVDEALRVTMTGGVLIPPGEKMPTDTTSIPPEENDTDDS